MLTFDKYATLDLMRFILSTTTDEKTMIRTWRLFRSTHKGPLFPVVSHRHQQNLNAYLIEELRESGLTAADIARIMDLHRVTVAKHLARFRRLTLDQADERRYERQQLLAHADHAMLLRQIDRQAEIVAAQRERSRPRL